MNASAADELIMKPGDDLTLRCSGEFLVEWHPTGYQVIMINVNYSIAVSRLTVTQQIITWFVFGSFSLPYIGIVLAGDEFSEQMQTVTTI